MTTDLVTWLREQLDADDQDTRRELASFDADDRHIVDLLDPNERRTVELLRGGLREVDAKRRIVDEHSPHRNGACPVCWRETTRSGLRQDYPCLTLRLLALPYAEHPGYRDEWRP